MGVLETSSLSFIRDDPNNKGYFSETTGQWVEADNLTAIKAKGSLQPFRSGNSLLKQGIVQRITERGYFSDDARVFYTDVLLKTVDQFTSTKADETTIDGHTYFVFSVKNWAIFQSSLDHYEYLLVRNDNPTGEP